MKGDARFPHTREQRPQHEHGSAHGFHEIVRRDRFLQTGRAEFHPEALIERHCDAHLPEEGQHCRHIAQIRNVAHDERLVREERRGQYRQGGIFGARYFHLARQPGAALDEKLFHRLQPLSGATPPA